MLEIEKTLQYIRDKAAEYAKSKSEKEYLSEFRKTKKALLINQAEKNGIKTGQARESYAYAHKEYQELLTGLKVAIEESERLRLLIKSAELRVDVWRSQNANQRKEFGNYGN